MKWINGIYLIVAGTVCWLWADGPLFSVGVVVGGRDIMGYIIPVIFVANIIVGTSLLINRTR